MTAPSVRGTPLASDVTELAAHYDMIVVGSGYGGSVAAARLARAGCSVCVLERGREYLPGDFPTTVAGAALGTHFDTQRLALGPRDGLYQLTFGEGITLAWACGLGGGSLVNSGIVARPDAAVLADTRWPEAFRRDVNGLERAYQRALAMLGPGVYPDDRPPLRKAKALAVAATRAGGAVKQLPACVSYEAGPNHVGVPMAACTLCGECNSGCNHGAKGTLTVTYLADAVAHGARVFTGIEVHTVARAGKGWAVSCTVHGRGRERFDAPPLTVHAPMVVLAAGVAGTAGILLRSREAGLPMSDRVGERVSANGNILGFAYDTGEDRDCRGVGAWSPATGPVGPGITTALVDASSDVHERVVIEDGAHPAWASAGLQGILWSMAFRNDAALPRSRHLVRLGRPRRAIATTMNLLAMSHDASEGRARLDGRSVRIDWPGNGARNHAPAVARRFRDVASALGGELVGLPASMTTQPLGGCVMANTAEVGTVDSAGRVFAGPHGDAVHPGLYVMDASVIPRSLAINPLWTITALAERSVALACSERGLRLDESRRMVPPRPMPAARTAFSERMAGSFAMPGHTPSVLAFTVSITVDAPDTLSVDPGRAFRFVGTAEAPALSPHPLTASDGRFAFFERDAGRTDAWRMTYACRLTRDDGHGYFLHGTKQIQADSGGLLEFWRDTTRLVVTVHDGDDRRATVLGHGELTLSRTDFARQLSTLHGGSVAATARMSAFFLGSLLNVYGAALRRPRRIAEAERWRTVRALRAPAPALHHHVTADGTRLTLHRYQGGTRGPVVLVHGYSSTHATFNLDTVDENLVEHLCARGYDVWLHGWRSIGTAAVPAAPFTLDDVARYDHPSALQRVCEVAGVADVHVIAHCLGAQTVFMSLLGAGLGRHVRSLACAQVAAHWESPAVLGIKVHTRVPTVLDALGVRGIPAGAVDSDGLLLHALDVALLAHPRDPGQRCRDPSCRRAAALFGEFVRHENLNAATHDRIAQHIGMAPVRPFIQMAAIARRGEIVDTTGRSYLQDLRPLALPITFMHGERNGMVGQGTTGRTWQLLRETFGDRRYRRVVLGGYGHNDAFIGRDASRDVFPRLVEHLAWSESVS